MALTPQSPELEPRNQMQFNDKDTLFTGRFTPLQGIQSAFSQHSNKANTLLGLILVVILMQKKIDLLDTFKALFLPWIYILSNLLCILPY